MTFKFSVRLNLGLTIVGAVFCLSPLFFLDIGKSYSTDDVAFPRIRAFIPDRSVPILASFFMVLIPAADLLIDFLSRIASFFLFKGKALIARPVNAGIVTRLSDIERLLFIIGVTMQSGVWFLPSDTDEVILGVHEICITNCSVLLLLGPIIIYLERCTTTFTERLSVTMLLMLTLGVFCSTSSFFFRQEKSIYTGLIFTGNIAATLAGVLFVFTVLLCFYRSYILTRGCDCPFGISQPLKINESKSRNYKEDQSKIINDRIYTHFIPFLHMISVLVIAAANFVTKFSTGDQRGAANKVKQYVTLGVEIVILVLEYRIRKNEVARGLNALLESKKSYVRYISHELRTPLNTAFLGLKLLTSEMKASKDPKDVERYDTLLDVNMSCTAAVDILNDLLCYEKLDSGILILHKEDVIILPFLNDCVSMFSVQARECGITMTALSVSGGPSDDADSTDIDDDNSFGFPSLLPHDTIFVDKFKMDQVIRNLISNALKFTPRGGTVTVKATFVQNTHPTGHQVTSDSDAHEESLASRSFLFSRVKKNLKIQSTHSTRYSSEFIRGDSDPRSLDGKLVVVVTDSGAGISAENQKRLFKDIVQFSPEKLQAGGGSGLGLWISGGIVDLHGGKISVHSRGENMGSTFTVEIPMIKAVSPLVPPSPTVSASIPSSQQRENNIEYRGSEIFDEIPARKHTPSCPPLFLPHLPPLFTNVLEVLVVDDSRLNRKMLLKCLQKDGHRCTEAVDGLEAVERVKQRMTFSNGGPGSPYDVILMDFIMPNMDGPTAVKEIRSMGYTAPIFGVTGNGK